MKHTLSKLLTAVSVILMLSAVAIAVFMRNAPPIITSSLHEADLQTEQFMEALCSGEYPAAEKLLVGSPDLTPTDNFGSPSTEALWDAYIHSFSYEFQGSCYSDEYGLYRNVTITAADLPALIADLVIPTANDEDILNALTNMLEQGDYTASHTLTLQLSGHRGQWKIHPTPQLIALLQGSIGGA